jgi:hypothetical protein
LVPHRLSVGSRGRDHSRARVLPVGRISSRPEPLPTGRARSRRSQPRALARQASRPRRVSGDRPRGCPVRRGI